MASGSTSLQARQSVSPINYAIIRIDAVHEAVGWSVGDRFGDVFTGRLNLGFDRLETVADRGVSLSESTTFTRAPLAFCQYGGGHLSRSKHDLSMSMAFPQISVGVADLSKVVDLRDRDFQFTGLY